MCLTQTAEASGSPWSSQPHWAKPLRFGVIDRSSAGYPAELVASHREPVVEAIAKDSQFDQLVYNDGYNSDTATVVVESRITNSVGRIIWREVYSLAMSCMSVSAAWRPLS